MVTRKELETRFTVRDGRIRDPGKFEQEPLWVPYFWEVGLEGGGEEVFEDCRDCDRGTCHWDHSMVGELFDVEPEDVKEFPELANVAKVRLEYLENGFVVGSIEEERGGARPQPLAADGNGGNTIRRMVRERAAAVTDPELGGAR